ncbi:MAG: MBL fold metallo-hydrolase [bacterium]|nr:MBL fold metallo-hydrolase [bacterium]
MSVIEMNPPVELSDSLVMLGTCEYPLFLVKGGSQGAIFEGGVGAMAPLLGQQLAELSIPADFIRQIFVAHAHPDHVMAIPAMQRMFPGVTVCASQLAARTMQTEQIISFFAQVDDVITDSLLESGAIRIEHKPEPLDEMQIPVDCYQADGDILVIGDIEYNVLFTPGHSDCSLCFHNPSDGTLIVSDATGHFLPEGFWWPNYLSHYGEYLDSIKRLASLNASLLCLGHNAIITGVESVRTYFHDAMHAAELYHHRIIGELKSGKSVDEIANQLATEIHTKMKLMPLDFFQKSSRVLVKRTMEYEDIEAQ